MIQPLESPEAGQHRSQLLVYAGRLENRMTTWEDDQAVVLSEWDVLPRDLPARLTSAGILVVLDVLSFPFETLDDDGWDVPLILVLPDGFTFAELAALLEEPILHRVTFFDRLVVDHDDVWDQLRRAYRWAVGQRLPGAGEDLEWVLKAARQLHEVDAGVSPEFEEAETDPFRYWKRRGEALGEVLMHRAVCSVRHDLRANKAMHRIQARALERRFSAARELCLSESCFDVLEMGTGVGRWASCFDAQTSRFVGLDISQDFIRLARQNYPHFRFREAARSLELPFEEESFDMAFTATVLHHNPPRARAKLLREMWRVVRPGGQLIFLEDFVAARGRPGGTTFPMAVSEFIEEVLDSTAGGVVLQHVEALRYKHDDFHRSGVVALSKVGVPKRW